MKSFLKKASTVLLCIVVGFIVFIVTYGILSAVTLPKEPVPKQELSPQVVQVKKDAESLIMAPRLREDMLEDALQSVVGISSTELSGISGEEVQYMGSGVIASEDGYIITNHHVIGARPEKIEITLHSGETVEGETAWSESALDLAIVKIEGHGYTYSKLGTAGKLRVGESVVAIGNPLSMQFQRTVTAGIVSALGRSISVENTKGEVSYMEDLIQTDASINPGNSGGPLLNAKGEVVGINTVKVSTAEGMGFAIPVNVCIPVIERLRNVGKFRTPYLGLYAHTSEAARYLKQKENMQKGLFVAKLDKDGPAFAAGIRYGDVITKIGGKEVNSMLSLREQLYKRQSGETVRIDFVRNGTKRNVDVRLTTTE